MKLPLELIRLKISLKIKAGDLLSRLTRHRRYVNREYVRDNYFPKVRNDIRTLERGLNEPKFERDKNRYFQWMIKKYETRYCPSTEYRFFSYDNKIEYEILRGEIDKLLARKDQEFSDLLGDVLDYEDDEFEEEKF